MKTQKSANETKLNQERWLCLRKNPASKSNIKGGKRRTRRESRILVTDQRTGDLHKTLKGMVQRFSKCRLSHFSDV